MRFLQPLALAATLVAPTAVRAGVPTDIHAQALAQVNADATVDANARWLAGMADESDPTLAKLLAQTDASWQSLRAERLPALREFATRHLGREQDDCKTLFYPFSGPDVLNAVALFPNCERIVMFGLEPVGELPSLPKLSAAQKARLLTGMGRAQQFMLRRNFFVTQYMSRDLQRTDVRGVVPLMSVMLVRTGYTLASITPMNVDGSAYDAGQRQAPRAVRLVFARPGGKPQEIFYANFDASDDGLRRKPEFLNYLRNIDATVTLMKAASYLLHDRGFSTMRAAVVEKSRVIVQDDTGLPYATLRDGGFAVTLLGNYNGTIRVFRYRYQRDLAAAYRSLPTRELLAFPWSYMARPEEVALQIGRRAPAAVAIGAEAGGPQDVPFATALRR